MVAQNHLLIYPDLSVAYLTYAYPSHIVIVIYGGYEHLQRSIRISRRTWDIIDYRIKERLHIPARLSRIKA